MVCIAAPLTKCCTLKGSNVAEKKRAKKTSGGDNYKMLKTEKKRH